MLDQKSPAGQAPAILITAACLVVGCTLLLPRISSFLAVIPVALVVFGPLLINLVQARHWRSTVAQVTLSISSVAYLAWFGYVYYDVFYAHRDPQASIAMIFVGGVALPPMLVFWVIAGVAEHVAKRRARGYSAADSRDEARA